LFTKNTLLCSEGCVPSKKALASAVRSETSGALSPKQHLVQNIFFYRKKHFFQKHIKYLLFFTESSKTASFELSTVEEEKSFPGNTPKVLFDTFGKSFSSKQECSKSLEQDLFEQKRFKF
jgi:hypothetical protein